MAVTVQATPLIFTEAAAVTAPKLVPVIMSVSPPTGLAYCGLIAVTVDVRLL